MNQTLSCSILLFHETLCDFSYLFWSSPWGDLHPDFGAFNLGIEIYSLIFIEFSLFRWCHIRRGSKGFRNKREVTKKTKITPKLHKIKIIKITEIGPSGAEILRFWISFYAKLIFVMVVSILIFSNSNNLSSLLFIIAYLVVFVS